MPCGYLKPHRVTVGLCPSRLASLASGRGESQCGSPSQSVEARVVAIRSDPLATGLNGQGREPGVLRNGSRDRAILAQGLEYGPVSIAGYNYS